MSWSAHWETEAVRMVEGAASLLQVSSCAQRPVRPTYQQSH